MEAASRMHNQAGSIFGLIRSLFVYAAVGLLVSACANSPFAREPQTLGERYSAFSYVPIDGVRASSDKWECDSMAKGTKTLTIGESLPDITTRVAVASLDQGVSLDFAAFKTSEAGHMYSVLFDQIFVDSVPLQMLMYQHKAPAAVAARADPTKGGILAAWAQAQATKTPDPLHDGPIRGVALRDPFAATVTSNPSVYDSQVVEVPVYVGAGIRLNATVQTATAGVKLTSPIGLAAAVDAGAASGSLTIQMLGLGSEKTAGVMPMASELNATTIQNALVALGSAKTYAYTMPNAINPRFVGFYNPVSAGPEWVADVITALNLYRPDWQRRCVY